MEQVYLNTTKVLKALSDPKRLQIVDMLSKSELCAHHIQSAFDISQPTLSHDMRVLKEAGITHERREGKNIFYSLNQTTLGEFIEILKSVFAASEDAILGEAE